MNLKSVVGIFIKRLMFSEEIGVEEAKNQKSEIVERGSTVISETSLFYNSTIGKYSYVSPNSIIDSCEIGKFCSIGPSTVIGFGEHPVNYLSTSPMFYFDQLIFNRTFAKETKYKHHEKVVIKNDVWIGANVYIKNGVTIGNGAIIAAGAVVIKSVPDFAIVGGVPGRILKYRFSENMIKKILRIAWWDLDEKFLSEHSAYWNKELNENDLDKLCELLNLRTH